MTIADFNENCQTNRVITPFNLKISLSCLYNQNICAINILALTPKFDRRSNCMAHEVGPLFPRSSPMSDSSPPKKRGAPRGNQNARRLGNESHRHGAYARCLPSPPAVEVKSPVPKHLTLSMEIAYLRLLLPHRPLGRRTSGSRTNRCRSPLAQHCRCRHHPPHPDQRLAGANHR